MSYERIAELVAENAQLRSALTEIQKESEILRGRQYSQMSRIYRTASVALKESEVTGE